MAQRFLIVVGDPTTGGGEAVQGFDGYVIECLDGVKRPVVALGYKVLCGQCGPTTVVEACRSWFTNLPLAYDGCALACGHKLVSKQQRISSTEVADAAGAVERATRAPSPATSFAASSSQSCRYDEQIQFLTQKGMALANVGYTLLMEDGRSVQGTTDAQGRTQRVSTEIPQKIVKAEVRSSPGLCCAQRFDPDHVPEKRSFNLQQTGTNDTDVGHSVQQFKLPAGESRGLRVGEIGMAREVFGDAIEYQAVKVHNGGYWLFFGLQDADTVVTPDGNMYWPTTRYKDDFLESGIPNERWFIHEMAHVWQHQLGYPVMVEGSALQTLSKMRGVNPYEYSLEPGKRLRHYNMEQQANILADYYLVSTRGSLGQVEMYGGQYRSTKNILQLLEYTLADFLLNPSSIANLPPLTQ